MKSDPTDDATQMPRILATRMGALFHYAIPTALHQIGMLERFDTDIWIPRIFSKLRSIVPETRRHSRILKVIERRRDGLPDKLVRSYPRLGLAYHRSLSACKDREQRIRIHADYGHRFCREIIKGGLGNANVIYTTNTQGLPLLEEGKRRGMKTFMEQTIAPFEIESRILAKAHADYPGWECEPKETGNASSIYREMECNEWINSDLVFCGSEFVKMSLIKCGVDDQRIRVVPYCFEGAGLPYKEKRRVGTLRVLTVGTVCLRKGAPWVLEAARELRGLASFRWVGPSHLTDAGNAMMRTEIDLTGSVPRSEVMRHFEWADVFLLPSLCEGSATVTYEAQSAGLPIVCTNNTGSTIKDQIDGFIVPIRSSKWVIERLVQLAEDRELCSRMGLAAWKAAGTNRLDDYANRLRMIICNEFNQ